MYFLSSQRALEVRKTIFIDFDIAEFYAFLLGQFGALGGDPFKDFQMFILPQRLGRVVSGS